MWSSEQAGRHDWNQTALIAAILINANRDPKRQRRPIEPSQLNPYAEKRVRQNGLRVCRQNRTVLKKLFAKK